MPAELHKGIALDDELRSTTQRLQETLAKLEKLAKSFEKNDHLPTDSQIRPLVRAREDLAQVTQNFYLLSRSKEAKPWHG